MRRTRHSARPKVRRQHNVSGRNENPGIAAVFKASADRERVCILNERERERCRRGRAMPRGENSATRRPAKRIKKIHEGVAPPGVGTRRESRARVGEGIHVPGDPRKIASSSGVDNGCKREHSARKRSIQRKRARNGPCRLSPPSTFKCFRSRDINELSKCLKVFCELRFHRRMRRLLENYEKRRKFNCNVRNILYL